MPTCHVVLIRHGKELNQPAQVNTSPEWLLLLNILYFQYLEYYFDIFSGISCGDPGSVVNASMSGSFLFEDTVTFTCYEGHFRSAGTENRTCQHDGSWDGRQPTCTSIYRTYC